MFEGHLEFGGETIANNALTHSLLSGSGCPWPLLRQNVCPTSVELVGGGTATPPWFDPSQPELSSRFYGVYVWPNEVRGLSDTNRSTQITEGLADGADVGRTRRGPRQVRVTGSLIAKGRDALDYGVSWLSAALDGDRCSQHGGACGVTDMQYLTDCPPERGEVTDYGPWVEEARNLFTNPSYETSAGTVEVYRNLVTNPAFEAGSGTVEVRRNLDPRPILSQDAAGISVRAGYTVDQGALTGGRRVELVQDMPGNSFYVSFPAFANPTEGDLYSMSVRVRNDGTIPLSVRAGLYASGPNTYLSGDPATIAPGATELLTVNGQAIPAGSTFLTPRLINGTSSAQTAGALFTVFDSVTVEKAAVAGEPFSGVNSPDPDLTASWVGAANASESVLTGASVAGISATNCLAIRSSKFGGSMRLIPDSASNNSYAEVSPYPGLLASQTQMGTVHLESPLTGTLHQRALSLTSASPVTWGGGAPNAAGSYPLRRSATPTSQGRIIFMHGGAQGSGDVYWTHAALVEGEYAGDWFDGGHPLNDADLTTKWLGAPNASESIVSGERLAGVTTIRGCLAIRSQRWARDGSYSGRLIRTSSENASGAYVTTTTTAPDMLTGLITLWNGDGIAALDRAVTLQDYTPPFTFTTMLPANALPPAGGELEVRTVRSSGAPKRIVVGAPENIGDSIWFDCAALIEGDYAGDWFDGDVEGAATERFSWLGAPAASASLREVRDSFQRPRTDEEYDAIVAPLRRFLHDVATTSGPLERRVSNRDEWWIMDVEWTWTAGRAWVFSSTEPVELPVTPTVVIQDTPYNLVTHPSAELAGADASVAYNYSTNPSVESNATGWSVGSSGGVTGGMLTFGRVTGELQAVGSSSFRVVFTATGAGTDGAFYAQQVVDVSGRPAGSRISINLWAAQLLMSGSPVRGATRVQAIWRSSAGGSALRTDDLGTVDMNGGAVSAKSILPPSGATHVAVRAIVDLTSWNSGTVLRLYADALGVTVP